MSFVGKNTGIHVVMEKRNYLCVVVVFGRI